jgi:glycosyltransferase involved in cell wall biosynthesis
MEKNMSAQGGSASGTKKVLFISSAEYDLDEENLTLKKKFENLANIMDVNVLGRGDGGKRKKYNSRFYLVSRKYGKPGLLLWMWQAYRAAKKIIKQEKIEIIIAQSPAIEGTIGAFLKKKTGCKLIVEGHGDWINSIFYYHHIPFEPWVKKILISMGRYSLKQADKVRVISAAVEKLFRKYSHHQNYYKFPTFTDIDIFKVETNLSYQPIILYAGWLYRLKGIQFLIEAFSRLQRKHPDYRLMIMGDGPYRNNLIQLAGELKTKNIEFTGWKPQTEVKDIMRKCTCVVLPSLSEGLGRVQVEAGMLYKPFIGANVDGIPELVRDGETGFLFERGNVDDLTDKLDKIMGNPELVRQMGKAGRAFMEDKSSVKRYIEMYNKMVND